MLHSVEVYFLHPFASFITVAVRWLDVVFKTTVLIHCDVTISLHIEIEYSFNQKYSYVYICGCFKVTM